MEGLTRRGILSAALAAGLSACAGGGQSQTTAASASASPVPAATDEAALRKKIASLLVAGFRGEQVGPDDWIVRAIRDQGLGGVILFDRDQITGGKRNITSPEQVTALIKTLAEAAPDRRLLVSIDQEGGQIARLNPSNGFPATQSQAEIGAANSPELTRTWAEGIASTLKSIGVNVNFTPVVDLATNPGNPAIARLDRSFSADPNVVVECATEEIRVHRANGIRTSIKHFPGFGSATGNTDFEVVDISGTWQRSDLEPFKRLIDNGSTDMVMVAHFLNRQLDPSKPVSLSRAVVTDLLRGELGWKGVVVTDDMQAVAIKSLFERNEAVALAFEAGVDLLTLCNQETYDPEVVEATVNHVTGLVLSGRLTEAQIDQSVARVDALRPVQ